MRFLKKMRRKREKMKVDAKEKFPIDTPQFVGNGPNIQFSPHERQLQFLILKKAKRSQNKQ